MDQLTLNVALLDSLSFETFYTTPSNEDVVSLLRTRFWQDFPQVFVFGDAGCGKSHLLQACINQAQESAGAATYLSMRELAQYGAAVLDGLKRVNLLALDDVDSILGDREWEEALFHLINISREQQQSLLISASNNPHAFNNILPDLASRLLWGPIYQLHSLNEIQAMAVFQWRAMQRGLKVTNQVAEFICKRYPRDIHSLMRILDKLDKASFNSNRKVTIKLINETLQK